MIINMLKQFHVAFFLRTCKTPKQQLHCMCTAHTALMFCMFAKEGHLKLLQHVVHIFNYDGFSCNFGKWHMKNCAPYSVYHKASSKYAQHLYTTTGDLALHQ